MSGVIPQPPEGFVVKDPPNLQHQLGPQNLPQQSQADLATRTTTTSKPTEGFLTKVCTHQRLKYPRKTF